MIAPPMHPVGLGFLRQASRPLHLLPRLSDPLTRDADKVHRALQAGSVLRCGVAGQLRQPRQTGMAMFRELRLPPTVRKYPQARPYSSRAGLFFLLDSVKAQRWNYLRLSSPFGARLSSRF